MSLHLMKVELNSVYSTDPVTELNRLMKIRAKREVLFEKRRTVENQIKDFEVYDETVKKLLALENDL